MILIVGCIDIRVPVQYLCVQVTLVLILQSVCMV